MRRLKRPRSVLRITFHKHNHKHKKMRVLGSLRVRIFVAFTLIGCSYSVGIDLGSSDIMGGLQRRGVFDVFRKKAPVASIVPEKMVTERIESSGLSENGPISGVKLEDYEEELIEGEILESADSNDPDVLYLTEEEIQRGIIDSGENQDRQEVVSRKETERKAENEINPVQNSLGSSRSSETDGPVEVEVDDKVSPGKLVSLDNLQGDESTLEIDSLGNGYSLEKDTQGDTPSLKTSQAPLDTLDDKQSLKIYEKGYFDALKDFGIELKQSSIQDTSVYGVLPSSPKMASHHDVEGQRQTSVNLPNSFRPGERLESRVSLDPSENPYYSVSSMSGQVPVLRSAANRITCWRVLVMLGIFLAVQAIS